MAETQSPNYKWVKPDIGGDASTWGNVLNQTIDAVDSVVYANQQAAVEIGTVTMFAGATAPPNWLICDGSSLATTGTYAALFAIIGYAHGGSGANFNLPNLQGVFPLGAGPSNALGSTGGSYSVTIAWGNMPVHSHSITDVAHSHGVNQWAHAHGIATGAHNHSISTGGHSHANVLTGSGVTGGVPAGVGIVGNVSTVSAGDLGGSTSTAGNLGGNTDTQSSALSIQVSGTGIAGTNNAGSGTPLSVVPSYVALNYIIRYQ